MPGFSCASIAASEIELSSPSPSSPSPSASASSSAAASSSASASSSSGSPAAGFALALLGLGLGRLLAFLSFDQVDAELGQHRHGVFDLVRRDLIGRQRGVQLVIGQIAALLAARHHLLDRDRDRIEKRAFGRS